jgi:MbtH protein
MPDDVDELRDGTRAVHAVVVNDEEQYSVWPSSRDLPPGWRAQGFRGSRDECLAHIEEIWTDMRPKSVRTHLAP